MNGGEKQGVFVRGCRVNMSQSDSGAESESVSDQSHLSRRSRVEEIPADHLTLIARHRMVNWCGHHSYGNRIFFLVESAARRGGNEEARWLCDALTKHGPPPNVWVSPSYSEGTDEHKRWKWVAETMTTDDDSLWAQLYRGAALLRLRDPRGKALLLTLIERGFVPAIGELGGYCWQMREDFGEGRALVRRAAELGDPIGMYWLGEDREEPWFELWTRAASMGHCRALWWLGNDGRGKLDAVKCAQLCARGVLYSGNFDRWCCPDALLAYLRRLCYSYDGDPVTQLEMEVMYAVGRELQGHELFWDYDTVMNPEYRMTIVHYMSVSHAARRAALQTVVVMRMMRLPRDIATVIAKLVYASREDVSAWWNTNSGCEEMRFRYDDSEDVQRGLFDDSEKEEGVVWVRRKRRRRGVWLPPSKLVLAKCTDS